MLRLSSLVLKATIILFTLETAQARPAQKPAPRTVSVAFSPTGNILYAASTTGTITVWDLKSKAELGRLIGSGTIVSITLSPDGQQLVSTTWEGGVTLWDLKTCEVDASFEGHTDVVEASVFSPDGATLATASWDGSVRLWTVSTGQLRREFSQDATQRSLAFSPDGRSLAIGNSGCLRVVNVENGEERYRSRDANDVRSIDYSSDGKYLIAALHGTPQLLVLDAKSGQEIHAIAAHRVRAFGVDFLPRGDRFVSVGDDEMIRIFEAGSGQAARAIKGSKWHLNVAVSPDGSLIATATSNGTASVWEIDTGRLVAAFQPPTTAAVLPISARLWDLATGPGRMTILDLGTLVGLAASPDGKLIAVGSWDGSATIYNAETGELIATLRGHTQNVWGVAFSPDAKMLATTSWDGTARLWNLSTLEARLVFRGDEGERMYSAAFSPDGTVLATGSGRIKLWNVESGKLAGEIPLTNDVRSVAFSPDGTKIAAGFHASGGRTVAVWDVRTKREQFSKLAHDGIDREGFGNGAYSVVFSLDGKCLASTGVDGTVAIWELDSGRKLTGFQSTAIPCLERCGPDLEGSLPLAMQVLRDQRSSEAIPEHLKLFLPKADEPHAEEGLLKAISHPYAVVRAQAVQILSMTRTDQRTIATACSRAAGDRSRLVREAIRNH